MLQTATQLRDRYTEALTYSSVQQYPEQAEAIQREIDNKEDNRYGYYDKSKR